MFCGKETLYTGCFGEIDCENHIAADEESVYDWGSITKTLTWFSALQLYEQGKLDLMDHTGGWCGISWRCVHTTPKKPKHGDISSTAL